jgi:hypothetical protein
MILEEDLLRSGGTGHPALPDRHNMETTQRRETGHQRTTRGRSIKAELKKAKCGVDGQPLLQKWTKDLNQSVLVLIK